jgi:hypothetical protein
VNDQHERPERVQCPCGSKHFRHGPKHCYFLMPEKRPKYWMPNSILLERFDDGLKKAYNDSKWKAPLERLLVHDLQTPYQEKSMVKDKDTKIEGKMSMTLTRISNTNPVMSMPLEFNKEWKDWWIFDSGSTCHVCHNHSLFLEYIPIIPGTEFIAHGDGRSQILGYGLIDILVKRVDGSMEELWLNRVFHAPEFMANVVFAEDAGKRVFFWNRRQQYIETQSGLPKWKTFKYGKQSFIAKTAVEPDNGILAGEMSATMYNSKSSSTSIADHSICVTTHMSQIFT